MILSVAQVWVKGPLYRHRLSRNENKCLGGPGSPSTMNATPERVLSVERRDGTAFDSRVRSGSSQVHIRQTQLCATL
jgi:hypothetical protein